MAKICFITDLQAQGSGYMSLSLPICIKLVEAGHDIKAIGLGNKGEQHPFPFSIFPVPDVVSVMKTAQLLYSSWQYDVMVVALDIPIQEGMIGAMVNRPFKYVGLFPIESDPLCFSWSMVLQAMDKPFIISEFGEHEAHKRYIDNAKHAPIGIDTDFWRVPSQDEYNTIRESFGIKQDEFVILTVADNQERKNLAANFRAVSIFAKTHPNCRYMLVTREKSPAGWKLRELGLDPFGVGDEEATKQGHSIADKLMIFERGMPTQVLWQFYAMSDAFLLLSKAEGLGLPIMEAMSCGVPVVGTDCTGISELVGDDRGYLVPYEYIYVDPFGNGRRYCADAETAARYLDEIYDQKDRVLPLVENARMYMETRTWDKTVEPILAYLKEVDDEKKEQEAIAAAEAAIT